MVIVMIIISLCVQKWSIYCSTYENGLRMRRGREEALVAHIFHNDLLYSRLPDCLA